MLIQITNTDSSMMKQVVYVPNLLVVEFNNGNVYGYPGVGEGHHANMIKAESPGKYFNEFIKPAYDHIVLVKKGKKR